MDVVTVDEAPDRSFADLHLKALGAPAQELFGFLEETFGRIKRNGRSVEECLRESYAAVCDPAIGEQLAAHDTRKGDQAYDRYLRALTGLVLTDTRRPRSRFTVAVCRRPLAGEPGDPDTFFAYLINSNKKDGVVLGQDSLCAGPGFERVKAESLKDVYAPASSLSKVEFGRAIGTRTAKRAPPPKRQRRARDAAFDPEDEEHRETLRADGELARRKPKQPQSIADLLVCVGVEQLAGLAKDMDGLAGLDRLIAAAQQLRRTYFETEALKAPMQLRALLGQLDEEDRIGPNVWVGHFLEASLERILPRLHTDAELDAADLANPQSKRHAGFRRPVSREGFARGAKEKRRAFERTPDANSKYFPFAHQGETVFYLVRVSKESRAHRQWREMLAPFELPAPDRQDLDAVRKCEYDGTLPQKYAPDAFVDLGRDDDPDEDEPPPPNLEVFLIFSQATMSALTTAMSARFGLTDPPIPGWDVNKVEIKEAPVPNAQIDRLYQASFGEAAMQYSALALQHLTVEGKPLPAYLEERQEAMHAAVVERAREDYIAENKGYYAWQEQELEKRRLETQVAADRAAGLHRSERNAIKADAPHIRRALKKKRAHLEPPDAMPKHALDLGFEPPPLEKAERFAVVPSMLTFNCKANKIHHADKCVCSDRRVTAVCDPPILQACRKGDCHNLNALLPGTLLGMASAPPFCGECDR